MTHTHDIKVDISTNSPILWMHINPYEFGKIFADMNCEDQVAVLAAMVEHMKPHSMQWDYIAIELEKPENLDLMCELKSLINGMAQ